MHLVVEPVAGLASSALQSAWIQRLKTSDQGDEIPLQDLELDGGTKTMTTASKQAMDQLSKEILSRLNTKVERWSNDIDPTPAIAKLQLHAARRAAASIHPSPPKRYGSTFLVKLSAVKFRKPPLPPPPSSGGKVDQTIEAAKARRKKWRVHGLDLKFEQQHRDGRRDLLAEFASRLEIKEKPTPLGTFHIVERKNRPASTTTRKAAAFALPGLTPVVAQVPAQIRDQAEGSTTASLNPEMMDIETSKNSGAEVCDKTSSMEANQSTMRSASTVFCGSSPYAVSAPSRIANSKDSERRGTKMIDQEQEGCPISVGKRRSEVSAETSKHAESPNVVKRGRFSEGGVSLAGPWLNRWSTQNAPKPGLFCNGDKVSSEMWGKRISLRQLEVPSAAAIAIVGAATRELQSYSPKLKNAQ